MSAFYRPGDPVEPRELGGKGTQLARLAASGHEVPRFVVLKASAPLPSSEALQTVLRQSGLDRVPLAVRSSAVGEDSRERSFAGQFRTVLGVGAEQALSAVEQVRASLHQQHAYGDESPPAMAVILQEMVAPDCSGVLFTADPVSGQRDLSVISAVRGLGELLVSGEVTGETYRVHQGQVLESLPGDQCEQLVLEQGEVVRRPLARSGPCLSNEQALGLAELGQRLARQLDGPQDVEWALVGTRLVVLQSRPITTLADEPVLWDNSNIIESYSGVTTPLTFSFARSVYAHVYPQFCRVMGVEESVLQVNRPVFENMLGLIRGRIYYNLLNWYRTLALLPGFSFNRDFMERMMGVRQKLPNPPVTPPSHGRWRDLARLVRMVITMGREQARLALEVGAFQQRVEGVLSRQRGRELKKLTPEQLIGLYRQLETELLCEWKAPLVNDFFAMIFHGLLGRLVEKWLPGLPPTLQNDLLCGEGGIISTRPAEALMELARRAPRELFALSDEEMLARLEPGFLDDYLERYGDRSVGELKLETETLRENPTALVSLIRAYLDHPPRPQGGQAAREAAELVARSKLRGWKARVFFSVLKQARERVRDRENLRFERTRVFGLIRRLFLALGAHLARLGALKSERDVFYLTREEVFGWFAGTAASNLLEQVVEQRRAEFTGYASEPAPPDRFQTVGSPALTRFAPEVPAEGELRGQGCCPGRVRAPVRIVRDPAHPGELRGHIMVAERTDPGWALLFPVVEGLLVQRGSLLSHSAIVARELGIPCVVGIPGLLERLQDGQVVEMDGTTGLVT
ncbi:phosphoenolpyruvate synthase [bacterium CPR1]|nr:phosphoenolpyruvate synthase [bacterium CPR1]